MSPFEFPVVSCPAAAPLGTVTTWNKSPSCNSTPSSAWVSIAEVSANPISLILFNSVIASPEAGVPILFQSFLATYFAEKIQKHKWIGYVGLIVILIVAIQLIIGGLSDYGVLSVNETFKKYF